MLNGHLTIGQLAERTGCKVQTIRYYEQIGLMPEALRTEGNQRRFGQAHHERLTFVRRARDLGFSISQVRELLSLADQRRRSCDAVDAIARGHLAEVDRKMSDLAALRRELASIISQCGHGTVAECHIIDALSPSLVGPT